jgi:hypothetical protein
MCPNSAESLTNSDRTCPNLRQDLFETLDRILPTPSKTMTESGSNTDRICPKRTGSILNYKSTQFFWSEHCDFFPSRSGNVIVSNVVNATASANTEATAATIANYPLLLYIPCP